MYVYIHTYIRPLEGLSGFTHCILFIASIPTTYIDVVVKLEFHVMHNLITLKNYKTNECFKH